MDSFDKIRKYLKSLDSELVVEPYESYDIHSDIYDYDQVVLINGEKVYVEIKKEIRPQHFPNMQRLLHFEESLLIIADYLTPKAKEILRKNKINYLDSFGNGYLKLKYIKVYIEKGDAKPVYLKNFKSFSASGGQVLFYLLKYPFKVNDTYRDIAASSKVSLGTVSKTFKTLLEKGFVVKWSEEQKYQLVRIDELLNEWIMVLNEKTLPAHKVGNFSTPSNNRFVSWNSIELGTFSKWGGETAASILTNYLKPENIRIYTSLQKKDIMRTMRLFPDDEGDIEIYEPFWEDAYNINSLDEREDRYYDHKVVHPLIVYAELMYTENDRNIEAANIIYNEYIGPNL